MHKYYLNLRLNNRQLHQTLSFQSQQHYEYLHSQSISEQFTNFRKQLRLEMKKTANHIHDGRTFRINLSDKFDNISKLFLLKKKLVSKSNELVDLKNIFHEKDMLYRYLNQIYIRREKLIQKTNTHDVLLKGQLNKHRKIYHKFTEKRYHNNFIRST